MIFCRIEGMEKNSDESLNVIDGKLSEDIFIMMGSLCFTLRIMFIGWLISNTWSIVMCIWLMIFSDSI